MGKRRGRTGPGGAVVSSLSQNSGGAVKSNKRGSTQGANSNSRGNRGDDDELRQLANSAEQRKGKNNQSENGSNAESGSLSLPSRAPKWLGKSPQQMLREWCIKNNRKRP